MAQSKIEWTDATWNPVTGCTKVSAGCKFCYAERMAKRLQLMGQANYRNGFKLTLQPHMLNLPFKWKNPRRIFVNSMSDLFHKDVPLDFIHQVFGVMNRAHWHRYQILTKRPERLVELSPSLQWSPNIWIGTSVEDHRVLHRINELRQCRASIKFLSLQPLIGPLSNLDLTGIDWVITGGETGSQARPCNVEWVREIRDACITQKIPFFFEQWGGACRTANGRELDGRTWEEMPTGQSDRLDFGWTG